MWQSNLWNLRIVFSVLFFSCVCMSDGIAEISVEELTTTTTSWNGDKLSWPEGNAEVTAMVLRMDEGDETGFHCHPVPTLGYVLRGTLVVETESGQETIFNAGDAAVEVVGKLHKGRVVDGPVELVAFYVGSTGLVNSFTAEQLEADPDACGIQKTDRR